MHPLIERAQQQGSPLIDGEAVTFVWGGPRSPRLIGDFNRWDDDEAIELAEVAPGVWATSL